MARFDVYWRRSGPGYLLDCQADLLSALNTRFVVPLLPHDAAPAAAARLNPVLTIAGEPHVVATQFDSAVTLAELGERVDTQAGQCERIVGAFDLLITGV